MKKIILKIFTFVLLISIMNSCSWFGGRSGSSGSEKLPVLLIKENTVLYESISISNRSHKFYFKIKAIQSLTVNKITYKVKIPNYQEIFQGTFYEFQQITIDKDFDLQDINGLTERFSSDKFCEQIQAINESDDGLTNMRIDLKFYTKEKGEILIKDVILDIRKDSLWVKIFNFLQGKTCDVRMIIKKFFGF